VVQEIILDLPLNTTQDDSSKAHLHAAGTLKTDTDSEPNHNHDRANRIYTIGINKDGSLNQANVNTQLVAESTPNVVEKTGSDGNRDHSHVVEGNTAETGGNETRPVSYGVNYIIKL